MKIEFIEVRRAYYHAPTTREVYVSLPPEDAKEGMRGLLLKSLQGTRDAAQNWKAAYSKLLVSHGSLRENPHHVYSIIKPRI